MAAALAIVVPMAGCEFKGGPAHAPDAGPSRPDQVDVQPPPVVPPPFADLWTPTPVAMRVYPSSAFVQRGGEYELAARVELTDSMGDSIKGVGRVLIELYTDARPDAAAQGKRLYAWDVDLLTLDDQRRHYESVTRTYLFRLKLDDDFEPPRSPLLVVTLTPPQGPRLHAQAKLGE